MSVWDVINKVHFKFDRLIVLRAPRSTIAEASFFYIMVNFREWNRIDIVLYNADLANLNQGVLSIIL